jgi:hypothetical protein
VGARVVVNSIPPVSEILTAVLPAGPARYLIDTTLEPMDMELVYSYGWGVEQGGGQLSSNSDGSVYQEGYNTDVWDTMLRVSTCGGEVNAAPSCYCVGNIISK